MHRLIFILLCFLLLGACTSQTAPSTTAVSISKLIATVEVSATPNAEEAAATRAAESPTPMPPTATIIPTETPYVGIFIGEAEPEEARYTFTEPMFGALADAQPTSNVDRCVTNPIDLPYVTAWRTNTTVSQRLGCPIQGGFGFFGFVQVFETGVMYYYPELNAVWAIRPLQTGLSGQFDYLENAPTLPLDTVQAPGGLIVPTGVFGNTWGAVDGLRGAMGFARTEPAQVPLGLQRFQNGVFLLDSTAGQVYALVIDGTVLGPFLTSETTPALISTPTPVGFEPAPELGTPDVTSEVTEEPEG